MQDCIMIYRKDKRNVYLECITFEKEFKQKCLEDDTWLERTIMHHAKKDLKEYCKNLQFNELINRYKQNNQNYMFEYISKTNIMFFVFGTVISFAICKFFGI
jgi:cystathionine beta-lyase family protein involved in aluminum resistance